MNNKTFLIVTLSIIPLSLVAMDSEQGKNIKSFKDLRDELKLSSISLLEEESKAKDTIELTPDVLLEYAQARPEFNTKHYKELQKALPALFIKDPERFQAISNKFIQLVDQQQTNIATKKKSKKAKKPEGFLKSLPADIAVDLFEVLYNQKDVTNTKQRWALQGGGLVGLAVTALMVYFSTSC